MPPYLPGQAPELGYTGYSPYQRACWEAFDTVYHAHAFGYSETRQPTPSIAIDQKRYEAWRERFDLAWKNEAHRDQGTRGLTGVELGENAMRHLYERFCRATALQEVKIDI